MELSDDSYWLHKMWAEEGKSDHVDYSVYLIQLYKRTNDIQFSNVCLSVGNEMHMFLH